MPFVHPHECVRAGWNPFFLKKFIFSSRLLSDKSGFLAKIFMAFDTARFSVSGIIRQARVFMLI
jgi:hypothetical protein